MKVKLKLFATLTGHLPPEARRAGLVELDVAPGTTVRGLIELHQLPPAQCSLVLINGVFLNAQEQEAWIMAEGDVLAIWPPVGGG